MIIIIIIKSVLYRDLRRVSIRVKERSRSQYGSLEFTIISCCTFTFYNCAGARKTLFSATCQKGSKA